jgi:hypothetical protein
MIVMDKQETPQRINRLIKAEILYLLKNYFDISAEDLTLDISVNDFGKYMLEIRGECRNMKIAHVFSSD